MVEALKADASLTMFRVRLARPDPHSITGTSDLQTTLAPDQLVICELEVTGDPRERALIPPDEPSGPTRAGHGSAPGESTDSALPKAPSRTVAQWVLSPNEIDLPVTLSEALQFSEHASVTRPSFPKEMAQEIRKTAALLLHSGADVLWVELVEPVGYLPLLPWEELLSPLVEVPVVRVSAHPIRALSPTRELTVVLGCSVSSSAWIPGLRPLRTLLRAIGKSLPVDSTVHVFADDLAHPRFKAALVDLNTKCTMILCPLPVRPDNPPRSTSDTSASTEPQSWEHPWMEWITDR